MEVLSIVAYNQPVNRKAIEELRGGTDAYAILLSLANKGFVSLGKVKERGAPSYYLTTNKFLEIFGMKSLADLPPM